MDLGCLPPLPMGLISAAARDLAGRVGSVAAAAECRLASRPAAVFLASVCGGWLINTVGWAHGELRFLVAISLGSLVATTALAVGWWSEPEELGPWAARALLAAVASALPALS